jgi:hypothetical protein
MTEQHYNVPSIELVYEWGHDANLSGVPYNGEAGHWEYEQHIATLAAQWGADQELDACAQWTINTPAREMTPRALYDARRPKPPSLKELAFQKLAWIEDESPVHRLDCQTIRRALEQIND